MAMGERKKKEANLGTEDFFGFGNLHFFFFFFSPGTKKQYVIKG